MLALRELYLDQVLFLIAGEPPHKALQGGATNVDRLRMVELALSDYPEFVPDTRELYAQGPSYTVDTLCALHSQYPDDSLFFIMGSDMLRSFPHWRQPEKIASMCVIVGIVRAGQNGGEQRAASVIEEAYNGQVVLLPAVSQVSSTQVRDCVMSAMPIHGMVPAAVEEYIYQNLLYQPDDIKEKQRVLSASLTPGRMSHSLYTMQRMIDMAAEYGAEATKARLAGLLHDCAKQLPKSQLIILSGEDLLIPPVLHASAGAVVAKTKYGIHDDEILRAIRLHSTGDENMSLLDKLLYLADITEPTRSFPLVQRLRNEHNLDRALLLAIRGTLCYIQREGLPLHPSTMRAYYALGGHDDQIR